MVDFSKEQTLLEQAQCMARTAVLVAAHGAGLTNLVFMRPNTSVMEIYPPKFFRPNYYTPISGGLGINHTHYRLQHYNETDASPSFIEKYEQVDFSSCDADLICLRAHRSLKILVDVQHIINFVTTQYERFTLYQKQRVKQT